MVKVPIEIIVHPRDIVLMDHGEFTSSQSFRFTDLSRLITLCDVSIWRDSSPISQNCVPDSYMLYIWVLVSDFYGCVFQSIWKTFFIGIKICPPSLELGLTMVVQALPIIVDDQIGDYSCQPCS